MILTLVLYILLGCYFLILFKLWNHIYEVDEILIDNEVDVSVLVCYRNEEKNLNKLLESFKLLDYDIEKIEWVFVNDHSEDRGEEFIRNSGLKGKVILINSDGIGKKAAFEKGVQNCSSNYVICTDADCEVSSNWIQTMISPLLHGQELVAGLVSYYPMKNWFYHVQQLELMAIVGLSKFLVDKRKPLMCNGANLAFLKEIYNQELLSKNVSSGDDVFLIQNCASFDKIVYNTNSLVFTESCKDFNSLINQKIRWSGKWSNYRNGMMKVLAPFTFLVFLAWLLVSNVPYFEWIIVAKLSLDFLYFNKIKKYFKYQIEVVSFLLVSFFYPVYVVLVGVLSVKKTYEWKGRKVS